MFPEGFEYFCGIIRRKARELRLDKDCVDILNTADVSVFSPDRRRITSAAKPHRLWVK